MRACGWSIRALSREFGRDDLIQRVASMSVVTQLSGITLAAVVMAAIAGCAGSGGARAEQRPPITIESVHITAAGHYVDLRYRVTDAERANKSLGPSVRPVLIDQATGMQMGVPMTAKLGPLRQTQAVQRPDHLYFVMFVNSARLVPGSKVTAQLGDIKIANLTVQ